MKCPFCIKVCKHCEKRIGEARILVAYGGNFAKHPTSKYGFNNKCKECDKKSSKEYYENNPEYFKQHYKDNKEHHNEVMKQWREDNPEYMKQWREDNSGDRKEYMKQYYKDNPDIFFNNNNKRRSRKENQGKGITKEQWLEMMTYFEWRCAYSGECLGTDNRSIDHIVPLAKGGLNEPWNCVPMIKSYNRSKNRNDLIEWYTTQHFYSEERLNKIYEWQEYAYNKYYEEQ